MSPGIGLERGLNMAALCPVCNGFLEEDFGLMSCPSCGASLFLEIDGSVRSYDELSKEEKPPPLTESESHIPPFDSEEIRDIRGSGESIELVDKMPVVDFSLDENADEGILLEEKGPYHSHVDDQEFEESPKGEDLRLDQNFLDGDLSLDQGGVYSTSSVETSSSNENDSAGDLSNMNEVATYGNSEESMGREGPLRVRVVVEGIDSPEMREDVRGALTDRKFLWDVEGIMRTIDSGCLVIESLTPLKAAIFIERIKGLPLEVRWEQSAINKV